uniref:Uncharacterized protein LOC110194397 isoform X4 n=1 Tax=Phascolarctos cinereus TaxID=38626 RepID=A0A6P5ITV0_PHACI|nr:uncharacterized protein LOC110194397 isoform X4 [Phascolarctos cinereus]
MYIKTQPQEVPGPGGVDPVTSGERDPAECWNECGDADQKQCHSTCICCTMDPKSLTPRGSPHTHQHQTCLMGPSHSPEWAPDTDDDKVSQCRRLPPQCGHSRDPVISHGPWRQGKGLMPKAGKFSHSQSSGASTTPLLHHETFFYLGQKPQSSRNSEDAESQSARDIQKPSQVFLSPLPILHPQDAHVVYDARKMKGPNCQVGGFVEALSLSTRKGSLQELSERGQNLISQTLERPSNLPTFPVDHSVEYIEYKKQTVSFPEGRNQGTLSCKSKSHTDKGHSERKMLLPPNSVCLQPSDYPTCPSSSSTPSQSPCPSEIPLPDQIALHQQQPSKVLIEPLEVSKGEMACGIQKLPEVSTFTQTHYPQGWNQNWVYKSLEMSTQNRPSFHQMPPSKGSGLETGHVVFDARQLRLNKEYARDYALRTSCGPKTLSDCPRERQREDLEYWSMTKTWGKARQ